MVVVFGERVHATAAVGYQALQGSLVRCTGAPVLGKCHHEDASMTHRRDPSTIGGSVLAYKQAVELRMYVPGMYIHTWCLLYYSENWLRETTDEISDDATNDAKPTYVIQNERSTIFTLTQKKLIAQLTKPSFDVTAHLRESSPQQLVEEQTNKETNHWKKKTTNKPTILFCYISES